MDKADMLKMINDLKADAFKEAEEEAEYNESFEETITRAEQFLKQKMIDKGINVKDIPSHLLMISSDADYLTGTKLH